MTQVTRLGKPRIRLTTGALGSDPTEVTDDTPPPVDRAAADGEFEKPVSVSGGTIAFEQGDYAGGNGAGASSVSLPAPPTAGNLLLVVAGQRAAAASTIGLPTGFSQVATQDHPSAVDARGQVVGAKVSDGTEQTVTFTGANPPNSALYLEVSGFGGVIPDIADVQYDDFSGVDSAVVPAVTLPGGIAAFVLAAMWKKTAGPNPGPASLTGYTTGPDTGFFGTGNRMRMTSWYVATNSSSTSYGGGTVSFTPASSCDGVTVNIALTQGDTVWVAAPAVNDSDDATYEEVDAAYTEVLHGDFGTAFRFLSARLLLGSSSAGSVSYDIEASNDAEFAGAVVLDSVTFTATGSFTGDEVAFTFAATTAYRYYRLVGPGDDIRIYSIEFYEPQDVSEVDLSLYQLLAEKDQPSGYAGLDSGGLVPVAELPLVEDLATAETDTSKRLGPDGAGGLTWATGGGGGSALEVLDEGVSLDTAVESINVVGPLAVATNVSHDVTITTAAFGTTAAAIGASSGGAASTPSKSDHVHATGAGTPSTQAFSDAASTGTGPAAAMTDHKHAMPANPVTAHEAASDPHTGYLLESLVDAKGDILTATADNTPARLAVGADDTVLMAESGEATGLKWVAAGTPSTQAFGDSAAVGTADTFTRGDHKHAMPADPTVGLKVVIAMVIDGGGATITTGIKGDVRIPFGCTLTGWTILADQSGAIKIDVWKDTLANYPPVDGDSITNGHEPEITASGTNADDTNITDWTSTAVTAGDTIRINVDSCTSIQRATLNLFATRT